MSSRAKLSLGTTLFQFLRHNCRLCDPFRKYQNGEESLRSAWDAAGEETAANSAGEEEEEGAMAGGSEQGGGNKNTNTAARAKWRNASASSIDVPGARGADADNGAGGTSGGTSGGGNPSGKNKAHVNRFASMISTLGRGGSKRPGQLATSITQKWRKAKTRVSVINAAGGALADVRRLYGGAVVQA